MLPSQSFSHSQKVVSRAYTFDDLVILPGYSNVMPSEVSVATALHSLLPLSLPVISAAMDTVTESAMAIAMARLGGIGILHKNMPPQFQAEEVAKVKAAALDSNTKQMTVDKSGRLVAGAAVGVSPVDLLERVPLLVENGVDVLVLDTAHGHSQRVMSAASEIKKKYGNNIVLVVGNIATGAAARALYEAGADVVKVGIGPGSICTTRVVAGIGMPQLSAVMEVADALSGTPVKIIADGGIRYSGDIVKALAAGAHAVMVGNLLAGSEESPGEKMNFQGRVYKKYRGMGSLGAMREGSKDRYFQHSTEDKKLVPEGIEGMVPFRGHVSELVHQLIGGLRAGLGYVGAKDLSELHEKARFVEVSNAGLRESHVYNVTITEEAPNYTARKE